MHTSVISRLDRYRGCLLGLATGDAVGTTLEFRPRGSFAPITDMVGGGPFGLLPGQWTDDTSMALCLAESLLECGGFDAEDQMERYCLWWQRGHLSSTGLCFDIGSTVLTALQRYRKTGNAFAGSEHPHSAGNGSIMRLAPVVLYFSAGNSMAVDRVRCLLDMAEWSSRTTHGAAECVDACRYMAWLLHLLLAGQGLDVVLANRNYQARTPAVQALVNGEWRQKTEADIRGSGYVMASLEAALWCLDRYRSFDSAILAAANLGEDADTTAAICGQLAGALYGINGIPLRWQQQLCMRTYLEQQAERLLMEGASAGR
ncbi:ADP-ribosylglycohydrolase family protein [Parathalassolituus penaei]|uniref:ADP-ribosylglycohydrolase family protein n=1 Tax=Parathalassolituus penaei TaxID=2997323 RepID=A0A9X3EH01_9GAMM|nr:ADP-ribosylglycohydrolase family protein [Parathalassolituus penaei]MCY0964156.1 ADP-ribosylglycohydrolase family protein [Parathalassolituus penaei]